MRTTKVGRWLSVLVIVLIAITLMMSGCFGKPAEPPPAAEPAPTEPAPGYGQPPPAEPPAAPSGIAHQVTIENFAFSSKEITIKVGDTVTWTQQDAVIHTATGDIWDSGDLNQGQTYSKTFDRAGTYDYHCNYHSTMQGKIIVE